MRRDHTIAIEVIHVLHLSGCSGQHGPPHDRARGADFEHGCRLHFAGFILHFLIARKRFELGHDSLLAAVGSPETGSVLVVVVALIVLQPPAKASSVPIALARLTCHKQLQIGGDDKVTDTSANSECGRVKPQRACSKWI